MKRDKCVSEVKEKYYLYKINCDGVAEYYDGYVFKWMDSVKDAALYETMEAATHAQTMYHQTDGCEIGVVSVVTTYIH